MLCRLVDRWLIRYAEGELPAPWRQLVEWHTADCPKCRLALNDLEDVMALMEDTLTEEEEALYAPPPDLWLRLQERLPERPSWHRRPRRAMAWGLAALCLVFGTAGYLSTRRPSVTSPPRQRMASVPTTGHLTPPEHANRAPKHTTAQAKRVAPSAGGAAKRLPQLALRAGAKHAGRRRTAQPEASVGRAAKHTTKTQRAKQVAVASRMESAAASVSEKAGPPPAERQSPPGQPSPAATTDMMAAAPANAAVRREGEPDSQALTQVPGGGQSSVRMVAPAARAKAASADAMAAASAPNETRAGALAGEGMRGATGFGGAVPPTPTDAAGATLGAPAPKPAGIGRPAAPATTPRGHTWLEDARRAKAQGKADRAAALYEIAVRSGLAGGELAEAHEALGDLAAQKGRWAQAAAEYALAAAAKPSRELLTKQAAALTHCGRQSEAHEVLRRAMSLPPTQGLGAGN